MKFRQYLKEVSDGEAFDLKETARRLNLSIWSVRIFVREGKLDALKIGRGYLIPRSALYAHIRKRVTPNFDRNEPIAKEDMIVPMTLDDTNMEEYAKHISGVPAGVEFDPPAETEIEPEPEPEPEKTEDEVEAERFEQYRPRPTSFSDGFFG